MDLPKRIYHGPEVQRLYRDLLAAEVAAGGAVNYAAPTGLVVGGSSVEGTSEDVARADHRHSLPAFGTSAGTFAQGNDSRFRALNQVWDARVVPSGLHASSDEFDVDTVGSGKWLDWDEGAVSTSSVDTTYRRMNLEVTAGGVSQRAAARYQAVPSDEFTVYAYVTCDGATLSTAAPSAGIFLGQDFAAANTDWLGCSFVPPRTSTQGTSVNTMFASAYNAAPTYANAYNLGGETGIWLRARVLIEPGVPRTTLTFDVCTMYSDGSTQYQIGNVVVAYEALHFGLGLQNTNLATSQRAAFHHFRVFDGVSSFSGSRNGGYL